MSHGVEADAYCLAVLYRGRQIAENLTPLILLKLFVQPRTFGLSFDAQDISSHSARQRQIDCGRSVPRCWPRDRISHRGQPRFSSRRHGTRCAWLGQIERELRKDAIPAFGSKHPSLITAGDIDGAANAIFKRDAPVMARRLIMHIKALYNYVIYDRPELAERYGITTNQTQPSASAARAGGPLTVMGSPSPATAF